MAKLRVCRVDSTVEMRKIGGRERVEVLYDSSTVLLLDLHSPNDSE